ncbi:S-layer homology domain-containing protein [Peribacillus acanthi]|uniref:S-layer homology domain-containing protein n=1 Tax=Peribacillus acanthi TaxID=2171554 RepID=UPI000D3ED26A|nr:S-layer homology domain-containing protein [Peribacillus acanthi]
MSYQPKAYRKFVATAATATLVATAIAPIVNAASFTDVAPKYKEAVDFVVSKGVNGLTGTSFGTSDDIKRVDAAVMIAKVLGLDIEAAPASGFTDVPARAEKYVNAIKAAGITNGKTATSFDANSKITRGELAIWIQKGFDLKGEGELKFTDVNDRYAEAVKALVANNVTNGVSETQFGVANPAKRGDYAIFLFKAFQVEAPPVVVEISSVDVVEPTKISVKFSDGKTAEINLEKALVAGDNEVNFTFEGKEFTTTVNFDAAAYALKLATDAVAKAEGSLLEADLAAANDLVTALTASNEKTLLQAKIVAVQTQINAIVAAVNNADTQVKLFNALNVKPFVNVKADYITEYETALKDRNFTTISGIQAKINVVNATKINAEMTKLVTDAEDALKVVKENPATATAKQFEDAQKAIDALPTEITKDVADALEVKVTVKADFQSELNDLKVVAPVLAATNQIQLLDALKNSAFKRVNADLIARYDVAITGADKTVAAIQADIDAVNLTAAQEAVAAAETALTTASVSAATALVNALENLDPNTVKEGLQAKLTVVTALIAVDAATTEAQLLTALQNKDLALTNVNAKAITEYKAKVDANVEIKTKANVQSNVIDAGNTVALTSAVTNIETNFKTYDATKEADRTAALASLVRLSEVTTSMDSATIDAELVEQYIASIKADLASVDNSTPPVPNGTIAGTDAEKAAAIQEIVKTVNAGKGAIVRLAAVNAATTAADMRTALTDVAVAQEATAFINLSSASKLEVSQLVLVAKNALETKAFANTAAVTTEISTQIGNMNSFLTGVNAATSITGMVTALDNAVFPEFKALTQAQKIEKAEVVLNKLTELKAQNPASQFTTISAVKQAAGL